MQRAWATRGLTHPPHFGRSAPAQWLPSTVRFYRPRLVDDHGQMTADPDLAPPALVLETAAHVEWGGSGEPSGPYNLGTGTVFRKTLRAVMLIPVEAAEVPRVGDRMEWTDDLGQTFRAAVRNVHSPQNLADHLEVEAEIFR